ncbi:MAG: SCP2 sterol-binding domain-containing protein, partial [Deltaproteobacteria bacterium]|nr:SCP2 sterol-binding domain-containing protein [Deltaproteobacteria bacterium]
QEIFEKKIPEKLQNNADKIQGINAVYEFQINGDQGGTWSIDLRDGKKEVVSGSTGAAGATITMAANDFDELISGSLNPQMAFMTGKLKVAGDMGLALKLGNILG